MTYHLGTNPPAVPSAPAADTTPTSRTYGYWQISDPGTYARLRAMGLPNFRAAGMGRVDGLEKLVEEKLPLVFLSLTTHSNLPAQTIVKIRYRYRLRDGSWQETREDFSAWEEENNQARRFLAKLENIGTSVIPTMNEIGVNGALRSRLNSEERSARGASSGAMSYNTRIALGIGAGALLLLVGLGVTLGGRKRAGMQPNRKRTSRSRGMRPNDRRWDMEQYYQSAHGAALVRSRRALARQDAAYRMLDELTAPVTDSRGAVHMPSPDDRMAAMELVRQAYPDVDLWWLPRVKPNRRRTSRRGGSMKPNDRRGLRAAAGIAQLEYALGRDLERASMTEEEMARAESYLYVLGVRLAEAEARLGQYSIRAVAQAQSVLDGLAAGPSWGSDPLNAMAREFSGEIPRDWLEETLLLSERDAVVREVLTEMAGIAELRTTIEFISDRLDRAKRNAQSAAASLSELSVDYFVGPLGEKEPKHQLFGDLNWDAVIQHDVAEPLPEVKRLTARQRLRDVQDQSRYAEYNRDAILRRLGSRIEANRSTVYAIPERKAYPITTSMDAYHATQRLKQGRVKSESEARRIVAAIKREHHDIWTKYLKDYPVSRIMTSKRKGLAARRRA